MVDEGILNVPPGERWYTFRQPMRGKAEHLAAALVDPELIRQWWGPERITIVSIVSEPRVGGTRRIVFRSGESPEMAFSGEYLVMEQPHRIQYTERFEQVGDASSTVTETITETDGGLLLEQEVVFEEAEHRDAAFVMGMEDGMRETLRRLAALVASM